jgi:hypothetical protein
MGPKPARAANVKKVEAFLTLNLSSFMKSHSRELKLPSHLTRLSEEGNGEQLEASSSSYRAVTI